MLTVLITSLVMLSSCGAKKLDSVVFNDAVFTYDGVEHSIEVKGLPDGATVTYDPKNTYTDITYGENPYLVFGRESEGLPEWLIEGHADRALRIPMREGLRSLNQSNSVAIAAYECMRQSGFKGLSLSFDE